MNTTPQPPTAPTPQTWDRMWATRPVRLPKSQGGNAYVAGVCEGIGVRYQIDPTLIRIAFVLAAFTGAGLSLYLLCWMLFPRYSVDKAPVEVLFDNRNGRYSADQSTGWVLVFTFLFLSGSLGFGSRGIISGTTLFTLAIGALVWYLLHQRAPQPPAGLIADFAPPAPDKATTPQPEVDLSAYSPAPGFDAVHRPQPPAWDPLGTVPELWDLPEPGPAVAPEPPKRTRVWPWVAVGFVVIAVSASGAIGMFRAEHPLANINQTITQQEQIQPEYTTNVGSINLDFSKLKELTEDTDVTAYTDLGSINVSLPTAVKVRLTCTTDLGSVHCPSDPVINPTAPGKTLTLHLSTDLGSVNAYSP
ncbi:MAG: PspC domain-containing protein [Corynebacterium sp.]|uniref:PspC domain-containing protein n=1 Tax=Corynebacterium sp. TaxID=1720 RepID=UPI0026DBB4EE|nr:PspC domain-containing protein [Corynebacterium sp.]MDO4762618.1 PspC domain-containing protein [Corynebacterium sp.]